MRKLITNPRVLLVIFLVIASLLSIMINGLEFGIDFKGGTVYQVELEEAVTTEKMATITSIIGDRLDAFGVKDTKVNSLGDRFISAQIAETDPQKVEQLENLLRTQGRFEATLDGKTLFEGSDIIQVIRDPAQGYGITEEGTDGTSKIFGWEMPFLLNQKAAESFSKGVFHRCTAVSFNQAGGTAYDCDKTYFFIDKPRSSVLIIPQSVYSIDSLLLLAGNGLENIPAGTTPEALLLNAGTPYIILDSNGLSQAQLATLEPLAETRTFAIVHQNVSQSEREKLIAMGFEINEVPEPEANTPWMWSAVGARQVISITPGIANLEPLVDRVENAKIFSQLVITGSAVGSEEAQRELNSLAVLLETGSLPIGIKSISKETISPLLGGEFLQSALFIGLIGLLVVSLVIYIRYRVLKLVIPILITGISEIIIILGFSSILHFNIDLASVAGILATVGTGVNDQIIIADELLRGEVVTQDTLANRSKKAFFIILATAATNIATMLPIIFLSFGLGKLRGFAVVTIVGILIGIIITRPAFSIIAQHIIKGEQKG